MTDADELARRYLALWTEYFTVLLADPRTMEMVKRWMSFAGQFSYPEPGASSGEGAPLPTWPPVFGPFGPLPAPPAGESVEAIAKLTRRIDELERRLGELERRQKSGPTRRPARASGD